MTGIIRRLFGLGDPAPTAGTLSYEEAKKLAQHDDPEVRRRLAARTDMVPEILYYLAEDPAPEVRREIAHNDSTPAQANLLLATDADDTVRSGLANKIARLAPGLTPHEQDRLRRMTYETLQLLARDQYVRVRQILAEALKDVAQAPPEVIRRLARDSDIVVAAPVLEFSPVLTDEDLLDIIRSQPVAGSLSAISRRNAVGPSVSDAIADSDDVEAIAVLLANPSAQIREETLDRLVDEAPSYEQWHAPLVRRPRLPARAAVKLAHFVADNLVQALQERKDLDADTAAAVAAAVHRRLEEGGPPGIKRTRPARRPDEPASVDKPMEVAMKMFQAGTLDEAILSSALSSSDREFVMAGLAVLGKVPIELVRKAVVTQSAKGILALAWKAGLSMPFAVQLQTRLGRIPPSEAIGPQRGNAYPLSPEEMMWQIKFFGSLSGG